MRPNPSRFDLWIVLGFIFGLCFVFVGCATEEAGQEFRTLLMVFGCLMFAWMLTLLVLQSHEKTRLMLYLISMRNYERAETHDSPCRTKT